MSYSPTGVRCNFPIKKIDLHVFLAAGCIVYDWIAFLKNFNLVFQLYLLFPVESLESNASLWER
jgi:hypothetical protein